ncbi:hypothetical protein HUJ05_010573 [Dendroctonus ponderosae]|nr:hypothetical protein HUJ05_010573 [Dendroctonus ponderosae]
MENQELRSLESMRIPEAIVQSKQEGHLYEISAQVTLPELEKPEEFSCKLHIPLANYTTRRETVFYPDYLQVINTPLKIIRSSSTALWGQDVPP